MKKLRKHILAVCLFGGCFAITSTAYATVKNIYHAGTVKMHVKAHHDFNALVWYPTLSKGVPWKVGPFIIPATLDAPIAPGSFPIIILSHGGGPTGGSPLILREISAYLAKHGFVVVAPLHKKARLAERSLQIKQSYEAVQLIPQFAHHLRAEQLGMMGFSLGGAVLLASAGAKPDVKGLAKYCESNPKDVRSCYAGPGIEKGQVSPDGAVKFSDIGGPLPAKALVLLDPFTVLYGQEGLMGLHMPVFLLRPKHSDLGIANTRNLMERLSTSLQIQYVPGGHFIFADVCPSGLSEKAPIICKDASGISRAKVHATLNRQITKFFHENLIK